jgi:hypothetical protein
MNEKEAREKWCPMYRRTINESGQIVDNATHSIAGYCCASDCMVWRWNKYMLGGYEGYCGLGGKTKVTQKKREVKGGWK